MMVTWLAQRLGVIDARVQVAECHKALIRVEKQQRAILLALADLREQLNMEPAVLTKEEIQEMKGTPRGDPQMGSW